MMPSWSAMVRLRGDRCVRCQTASPAQLARSRGLRHLRCRWRLRLGAAYEIPTRGLAHLGDGSSAYSLAEFDTFLRHKLPVIAVVGTGCLMGSNRPRAS